MQHTETLNLNLIQPDDTFSPDPLNENAQALEAAVEAARQEARDGDSALDARLIQLEAKHLVAGSYTGTGSPRSVSLGFTPKVVLIHSRYPSSGFMALSSRSCLPSTGINENGWLVRVVDGGFEARNQGGGYASTADVVYHYIAFD